MDIEQQKVEQLYIDVANGTKDVYIVRMRQQYDKRRKFDCRLIPVDGEKYFNQPGMSHGFVHFADPDTMTFLGCCGVNWFVNHAKREKVNGY